MKFLVLDKIHPAFHELVRSAGHEITEDLSIAGSDLSSMAASFEVIIVRNRVKLDKTFLDFNQHLKAIGRCGSGLENIDVAHARSLGIEVVNSPEGNARAVGEHALAMLLTLANHIIRGHLEVQKGQWNREKNRGWEVGSKTVGIIGYGNTGKAFARALGGMDCRILAYDKYAPVESTAKVQSASQEEIMDQCDVISLHLPLTDETRYLINEAFIDQVKHPFVLINTSRGPIVNIAHLLSGMDAGQVSGACLDVLEYEKHTMEIGDLPDDFKRLAAHDNVVLSPHVAGLTAQSLVRLSEVLAQKILKVL
jgi:D-3-phosphoglycerate dehydrogenase